MKKFVLAFMAVSASGQQIDLSSLDKFATRAKESTNVTLDKEKLRLASQFLMAEEKDQQKMKELLANLEGIHVRSLEFDKKGEVTQTDLEPIRKQLRAPGWSKIIDVKGKDESAEVYFFSKGDKFGGMTVIAFEEEEVSVVNIVGPIDLATLMKLGGSLGIPNISIDGFKRHSPSPERNKKNEDDENI